MKVEPVKARCAFCARTETDRYSFALKERGWSYTGEWGWTCSSCQTYWRNLRRQIPW